MKKIVNFLAMAAFVVALSSCGSKPAETTETAVDTVSTMESAPAEATPEAAPVDSAAAMSADTTAH